MVFKDLKKILKKKIQQIYVFNEYIYLIFYKKNVYEYRIIMLKYIIRIHIYILYP